MWRLVPWALAGRRTRAFPRASSEQNPLAIRRMRQGKGNAL